MQLQPPPSPPSGSSTANHVGYVKVFRIGAMVACTFCTGFQLGYHHGIKSTGRSLSISDFPGEYTQDKGSATIKKLYTEQELDDRVKHQVELFTKLHNKQKLREDEQLPSTSSTQQHRQEKSSLRQPEKRQLTPRRDNSRQMFPQETESFVAGMSLVDRDSFAAKILVDMGIPLDKSEGTNQQVLLLHAKNALPNNNASRRNSDAGTIPVYNSVDDAVKNCNYVNVILTEQHRDDQCIAIVGQYNSYHVHKYMRVSADETDNDGRRRRRIQNQEPVVVDKDQPLRLVPRGTDTAHAFTTQFPLQHETQHYWNTTLRSYLNNLDSYLEDLRPILKGVALCKTVIVMVCNRGQSDLLANFVCSARARDLDISGILVFATDLETHQQAQGLGLESYYREDLFQSVPKDSAQNFGDKTYADAIVSKIFCVQLVSMLGYDILFQDVDLVWYRDPLEYFQGSVVASMNYDIYMQHDGNRAQFYMPYSGNTGFYFVKNNPRTQYFLNQFLVAGDIIAATTTHQAPFLSLLSEHASLHGLKVKILPTDDYPGGYHFQDRPVYMRQFLDWKQTHHDGTDRGTITGAEHANNTSSTIDPKIFHMSWTDNKARKIQYFQQLGEWYVQDKTSCSGSASSVTSAAQLEEPSLVVPDEDDLASKCCSLTPIVKCHYSDKPSVAPCVGSPTFKKGAASFW